MAETKAKPWTEAEKLSVLFQIIEAAPIPWDTLKLPEGRTKKAVQVMIDKEKRKMKKAREAEEGGDGGADATAEAAKTSKGKRKTASEADGASKKAKAPRKKKSETSEAAAKTDGAEENDESKGVKAEPEDADTMT